MMHPLFQAAPIDIALDFGQIPIGGHPMHTLELRNENPIDLGITPITSTWSHILVYFYTSTLRVQSFESAK